MTLKSTIDIELDTSKFERFAELFKRYDEAVRKQPEVWKKIGGIHQQHAENFAEIAETMGKISQLRHKNLLDAEDEEKHLTASARLWTSIAASTKGMAVNIGNATTALIRWSGILGAVTGLLGAGGLYGIDRMAAGLSGQRKSAMGRGMSIGQQTAFGVNFGRLLDTDSFLDWVAGMGQDITKQGPAFSLLHHKLGTDTGANALQMLDAMRALARATPVEMLGSVFKARGLDESGANARALHDMGNDEYKGLRAGYGADVARLGISDKTAKAWQDFTTQMSRASEQMKRTFETGLIGLQPGLMKLSSAMTDLVTNLMKSQTVKTLLDELAHGLDYLSKHVGSLDSFFAKFEKFDDAFTNMPNMWDLIGGALHGVESKHLGGYMSFLDLSRNIGMGTLEAVSSIESNDNPKAIGPMTKWGTAKGQFGLLDMNSKGIDPLDPVASAERAAQILYQLMREFHGDRDKVFAAYHSGAQTVESGIAKYGAGWRQELGPMGQDYLRRVDIYFHNNPGVSASVAGSQLGATGSAP